MDFKSLAETVDDLILDSPLSDGPILYRPLPGVELEVRGVFSNASTVLEMGGDGMQVVSEEGPPTLRVALKDFLPYEPAKDHIFVIRGSYYQAEEVHPDGLGAARIVLRSRNAPA